MWVIVALADGPINMRVVGDENGKPFTDKSVAEQVAQTYRLPGVTYSVYVVPLQKAP